MGSSVPEYSENHLINSVTGYLENPAYSYDFDSDRKVQFLNLIRNGTALYTACSQLHIHHSSVNKAFHNDQLFKQHFKQAQADYADDLETVSMQNALNPKSVIERIFQLKRVFPEKYADGKRNDNVTVNVNISGRINQLESANVMDVKPVDNQEL